MAPPDDVDLPRTNQPHVGPRTEIEQLIAEVWAETLVQDEIGVHADFFDLGGQSLHVTQVINRLELLTGLEVDLQAFFEAPTVAGLAGHLVEQFAALEEREGSCAQA